MKKRMIFIAAAALMMVAVFGLQVKAQDLDTQYAKELLKPGTTAPDFTLTTPTGKKLTLSQFKGRYVVLDFWASWCPDCRKDAPNLVKAYNQYKDKNVAFVGVSFDTKKEAWQAAIKQYGIAYHQGSELKKWHDTVVSAKYNIKWIPSIYLIDPEGKVVLATVMSEKLFSKLSEVLK